MNRENGQGEDLLPRWYYDKEDGQCKRFLYKGLKGNANNFITSVQCMEQCGNSETRSSVLMNPCAIGIPARATDNSPITCTGTDESACPSEFYCQVSNITGTCCGRTSSARFNLCNLCLMFRRAMQVIAISWWGSSSIETILLQWYRQTVYRVFLFWI